MPMAHAFGRRKRGLLLGLLGLLCAAFTLADTRPPAQALRSDETRFVIANAEFTLLHEMGHLLIAELKLPVLGREEDAADQLGFMGLLLPYDQHRDANFYAKLLDITDYWRLEWRRTKSAEEEVHAWDSHGLDAQRFYNLACLAYGSDPDTLEWIPEITGLPVERALYCDQEYQQVRQAVAWVEQQYRRDPGQAAQQILVIYDPPPANFANGEALLELLRNSGILESVAQRASNTFALPRELRIRLTSCGGPDAWYNRNSGDLALCYELLEHFRGLARQLPHLRSAQSWSVD